MPIDPRKITRINNNLLPILILLVNLDIPIINITIPKTEYIEPQLLSLGNMAIADTDINSPKITRIKPIILLYLLIFLLE